jgi:sugar phosphate permease
MLGCRCYRGVLFAAGFMQATGWPSVVAVMGNWYGKGKRGAVMGTMSPAVQRCDTIDALPLGKAHTVSQQA